MSSTNLVGSQSVVIPSNAKFLKKLLAFSGPGYLIAVGYMDPGNWATDLAGGSAFGYTLLSVILFAGVLAMFLQYLATKLGIATGQDLAEICRATFPKAVTIFLWLMAEIMIIACDLAEVIGTAIALNLLFHLPLIIGVIVTAADVFVLLLLQNKGIRYLESFVIVLIATVAICFGLEILFSQPHFVSLLGGFVPASRIFSHKDILYIAVGIIGATIMPHNLYLHSAIVQTRGYTRTPAGKKEALRFAGIDSTIALTIAFFVNAAILVVAASVFYVHGHTSVATINQAYKLLTPLLGVGIASALFAIALLACGQNSTITGTMAGQVIMEGFLNLRVKPWLRRLITRGLAIIPATIIVIAYGQSGLARLLIFSQVILSIQLPFAVFPLVYFTSSKAKMGQFVNSFKVKLLAGATAIIIAGFNIWLIVSSIS